MASRIETGIVSFVTVPDGTPPRNVPIGMGALLCAAVGWIPAVASRIRISGTALTESLSRPGLQLDEKARSRPVEELTGGTRDRWDRNS
jgi:hypothetical protein